MGERYCVYVSVGLGRVRILGCTREYVRFFFIIVMRDWACACVHNREFKNMCVFIRMRDGLVLAYTRMN